MPVLSLLLAAALAQPVPDPFAPETTMLDLGEGITAEVVRSPRPVVGAGQGEVRLRMLVALESRGTVRVLAMAPCASELPASPELPGWHVRVRDIHGRIGSAPAVLSVLADGTLRLERPVEGGPAVGLPEGLAEVCVLDGARGWGRIVRGAEWDGHADDLTAHPPSEEPLHRGRSLPARFIYPPAQLEARAARLGEGAVRHRCGLSVYGPSAGGTSGAGVDGCEGPVPSEAYDMLQSWLFDAPRRVGLAPLSASRSDREEPLFWGGSASTEWFTVAGPAAP